MAKNHYSLLILLFATFSFLYGALSVRAADAIPGLVVNLSVPPVSTQTSLTYTITYSGVPSSLVANTLGSTTYSPNYICILPNIYNSSGTLLGPFISLYMNWTHQLFGVSNYSMVCNLIPASRSGVISYTISGLPLGVITNGVRVLVMNSYGTLVSDGISYRMATMQDFTAQNYTGPTSSIVASLPPSVGFYPDTSSSFVGSSVRLTWFSNNATSCTASGNWSGSKNGLYGSEVLPAYTTTGDRTYNLSCTGAGGTTVASPIVMPVNSVPLPSVFLFVSPTTAVTYNTSLDVVSGSGVTPTLSWFSQNATSCTASGLWSGGKVLGFGPAANFWQETVGPYISNGTYTYNLSCTGAGGTKVVTVTVNSLAAPTVTLPTVASVTSSGAMLGATVTAGNPAAITARGTCWGTTNDPTTNCTAEGGTTTGTFTQARTGMTPNTLYYYRGYATNSTGTGYSTSGSFTTSTLTSPTVSLPTFDSVTSSSARLGATVTAGNPAAITARGTCWGTTNDPNTNCMAQGGLTTGPFAHIRTGMTPNTLYYYRGYATNSTGTGYSTSGTFTTSATLAVPTVTTPTVTSITTSGATLGANVTSLGNPATITARGTCWRTIVNPTNYCVAEGGTTTGPFAHTRTGMTPNTSYYYRGYATNSAGTGYSTYGWFTTTANIPVVNGGWSLWTPWDECSLSCGGGTQSRRRECINPPPSNGGLDCVGSSYEDQVCNTQACAVVCNNNNVCDTGETQLNCYNDCKPKTRFWQF